MRTSPSIIASAIINNLKKGVKPASISKSLAAYLIEEKQLGDRKAILREIERKLFERDGTLYVHAVSAFVLDKEQIDEIARIFKDKTGAKRVIVENEINESVIGGVRCETAEMELDLTVYRQLQRLRSN